MGIVIRVCCDMNCLSVLCRVLLVGETEHITLSDNKQALCHLQLPDKDRGTTEVIH